MTRPESHVLADTRDARADALVVEARGRAEDQVQVSRHLREQLRFCLFHRKVDRCKATWKKEFKLPWREAGPPNHDDKV